MMGAGFITTPRPSFKDRQMQFARVRNAEAQKGNALKRLFADRDLSYPPAEIFIRIFKRERTVELWARDSRRAELTLMREFAFCAMSGVLGPKRRQGDGQIPEGIYRIDRFNPTSNFHLSLGLNYPNEVDRINGAGRNLGGDVFIHGGCATIGCVPITDDGIKELYLVAVEATSAGQTSVPVHVFPARLEEQTMRWLDSNFSGDQILLAFWRDLKPAYDLFEKTKRVPKASVDRLGRYRFTP